MKQLTVDGKRILLSGAHCLESLRKALPVSLSEGLYMAVQSQTMLQQTFFTTSQHLKLQGLEVASLMSHTPVSMAPEAVFPHCRVIFGTKKFIGYRPLMV